MAKKTEKIGPSPPEPTPEELFHKGTKVEQLVDALWNVFGGAEDIADMVHRAYIAAKDGSMTQVRIVDGMMKLFMNNDAKSKSLSDELDEMTEQQLEAIFREAGDVTNRRSSGGEESSDSSGVVYSRLFGNGEHSTGPASGGVDPGGGGEAGSEADGEPESL